MLGEIGMCYRVTERQQLQATGGQDHFATVPNKNTTTFKLSTNLKVTLPCCDAPYKLHNI